VLEWRGDSLFEARGKVAVGQADGDGVAALSPMETLLAALASCAATDIVDILRKGRQPLRGLSVHLSGDRRAEVPRGLTRVRARVQVTGAVDPAKAERAAYLAFEKYCSVRVSLDPAIPIDIEVSVSA
jgi:putative redox protein